MKGVYEASYLPLVNGCINYNYFFDELIDATARLEVYKEKLVDSKLSSKWFMPTLQQKEALESSKLEGTQATLDGVLSNQAMPTELDENINEVINYWKATSRGMNILSREEFSNEFFKEIHTVLMDGNVRKPQIIGEYRTEQNYIGKNDISHEITFIPPAPEKVPGLMDNLISYINNPDDTYKPLVRTAIVHAQFETIHPFMDGNGRVGRMLIPFYLYYTRQIELPCFFISEALEHDKFRYYTLLNGIREKNDWNEWIKFFLETVTRQCGKYITIVGEINKLYERHFTIVSKLSKSSTALTVMNMLYEHPITTAKKIVEQTRLPMTSVNRLLNAMVDAKILITDGRQRNKKYIYYGLLDIIR
uniref:Fic family protein n=1 Tax=Eubacterium cellulosolvens TaxID=29322 RepID=UPI0004813648|nr:Fic family protein [[Eubacterium] cellulosolvens]